MGEERQGSRAAMAGWICRGLSLCLGSCLALGTATWTRPALANGRPPNTISVDINPHNSKQWVVGTTFGLGLSHDCGRSYRYVCENVIVNKDAAFDNAQGFTGGDFRIVFGTDGQVVIEGGPAARSIDGGIQWQTMAGLPTIEGGEATYGRLAPSVTANQVYLPYYDREASYGQKQYGVSTAYRSRDAGASWQKLTGLSAEGVNLFALQEAPSDAEQLLAVGQAVNTFTGPWVVRSTDGGGSWSSAVLAPVTWMAPLPAANAPPPQLNQIFLLRHPKDPQLLWVAGVIDTSAQPGQATLLRSADGGQTFAQVAQLPSPVRNLAVGADGREVWAALSGNSAQGNVVRSEDGGLTFKPLPLPKANSCVTRWGPLTLLCGNFSADGFSVAVSGDGGITLHRGMQLSQLVMQPFADGSLAAERCGRAWPTYAQAIGANPAVGGPAAVPVDPQVDLGGLCDGSLTDGFLASQAGTLVAAASGAGAAVGDGSDSSDSNDAAGAAASKASKSSGGCACQATAAGGHVALWGLGLAGWRLRRGRRPFRWWRSRS